MLIAVSGEDTSIGIHDGGHATHSGGPGKGSSVPVDVRLSRDM